MSKKCLGILVLLYSLAIQAQEYNIPFNRDVYGRYESQLQRLDNSFHTSVKPYREAAVRGALNKDSIDNTFYSNKSFLKRESLLYKKLRKEDLLKVKSDEYSLALNPLLNLEFGRDLDPINKKNVAVNTRGVMLSGTLGSKFAFSTSFYENQGTFLNYIDNAINRDSVVPGQGFVKFNEQGKNRYDYAMATGYISYTPSKFFNMQLGNDKNFIGDGYRSLLLSDNAFSYPYLKLTTQFWKLQYTVMYAQFLDLRAPHSYELGYRKKYGTFHYLNLNIGKRLSVGLYESVIWQESDSSGYRGFDLTYLNPVIFYRPVEFSLGSPDNVNIGLNLKYKLTNNMLLYGQVMLDEFLIKEFLGRNGKGSALNKQGYQFGGKWFNMFGVPNLNGQSELNYVNPYTYAHYTSISNYAHYNQPLAHPLGSNFYESVSFLSYRIKSFFIEGKLMYAIHGQDIGGFNYGNDLFKSYHTAVAQYGNTIGQGLRTRLTYEDIKVVYIINPKYNLNAELGVSLRQEVTSLYNDQTKYIYFGLRTNLTNKYYDF